MICRYCGDKSVNPMSTVCSKCLEIRFKFDIDHHHIYVWLDRKEW